jgi:hypothetical protein
MAPKVEYGAKSGAAANLTHLVPMLHIRLPIDPADASSKDDKFTLSSSDGKYKKEMTVKDDRLDGDQYVDLVFENLKTSASYTLEINPGAQGSPYKLFENVPFQELVEYYSVPGEGDELEETQGAGQQGQQKAMTQSDWDDQGGGQEFGGDAEESDLTVDALHGGEKAEEGTFDPATFNPAAEPPTEEEGETWDPEW